MSRLVGQTVAIVGASSGIGLATARLAANRGAGVTMLSRSIEKLRIAAHDLPGQPRIRGMDMLDRSDVAGAASWLGRVDHLVLTAVADETTSRAPVGSLTAEQVERSFDKLRGYVHVVSAIAKQISPAGSITLLSGASALKPPVGFAVLAAAAASIEGLARALASEMAPIRVNVVMPGLVDTTIHQADREETKAWAEASLPVRYFGQPSDIAEAILAIATNRYVTGQTLVIDGGLTRI